MSFQIGKIRLELSYPLVVVMTAVIILDTSMSVIICFISAVCHELGHIAMLKRYHTMPERIKLTLFDIAIIDQKQYSRNNKQELVVTLAGVTVNFFLSAVSYMLFLFFKYEFLGIFYSANLALGLFNSMPVDNLDGGQALKILLCSYFDIDTASRILDVLSLLILVPCAFFGFLILLDSRYNFTLLITSLYLIALILFKKTKY